MEKTSTAQPDIKNYLQIYQYLKDVYSYRKSTIPGFSYEAWCLNLGISSRSHLRLSIIGRRNINEDLAQKLIKDLNLSGTDRDYFSLLILHNQSANLSQKSYYAKKMAELLPVKIEKKLVTPTLELLKDPTIIALRLFLTFDDVNGQEKEISDLLNIPLEEIRLKLKILESHQLVKDEGGGMWRATSKWVQFSDSPGNEGIRAYHASSLRAARNAIEQPADTRYFRSLMWALNTDEYIEFISEFNNFINQMNLKFEKEILADRKLMQLNINLIPAITNAKDEDNSI